MSGAANVIVSESSIEPFVQRVMAELHLAIVVEPRGGGHLCLTTWVVDLKTSHLHPRVISRILGETVAVSLRPQSAPSPIMRVVEKLGSRTKTDAGYVVQSSR